MPLAPLIEEKVLPCSNNNLIKAKVPSSFLTTRCHHFCLVQVKSWWSPCFPTPSDATTSRCWSNKIIPHSAQAPRERESRASTASTLPFYCASYYSNSASPMRPTYWIELNWMTTYTSPRIVLLAVAADFVLVNHLLTLAATVRPVLLVNHFTITLEPSQRLCDYKSKFRN